MDRRLVWFLGIGLLVALVVAGIVSGYASSDPDGLERVSIDQGFADTAGEHDLSEAPLALYRLDGVDDRWSTGLAGVIGVVAVLGLTVGLLYGVRRFRGGGAGEGSP